MPAYTTINILQLIYINNFRYPSEIKNPVYTIITIIIAIYLNIPNPFYETVDINTDYPKSNAV